ncbi:hypothetical protein [Streptomyces sp. A3M-1-3]|uniref:ATP-binding protein n=1 Tax=Streptomyces sp. A3M-1-3 TaxID=2962044 RepID=UPI0027E478C4|nr:hypothetical protein [Streptomyces sp. A3M-1-3]
MPPAHQTAHPAEDSPATGEAGHLFPRHRRSVGRARAVLRQQLTDWKIPEEPAETAVLLLSELVTNAGAP